MSEHITRRINLLNFIYDFDQKLNGINLYSIYWIDWNYFAGRIQTIAIDSNLSRKLPTISSVLTDSHFDLRNLKTVHDEQRAKIRNYHFDYDIN